MSSLSSPGSERPPTWGWLSLFSQVPPEVFAEALSRLETVRVSSLTGVIPSQLESLCLKLISQQEEARGSTLKYLIIHGSHLSLSRRSGRSHPELGEGWVLRKDELSSDERYPHLGEGQQVGKTERCRDWTLGGCRWLRLPNSYWGGQDEHHCEDQSESLRKIYLTIVRQCSVPCSITVFSLFHLSLRRI